MRVVVPLQLISMRVLRGPVRWTSANSAAAAMYAA